MVEVARGRTIRHNSDHPPYRWCLLRQGHGVAFRSQNHITLQNKPFCLRWEKIEKAYHLPQVTLLSLGNIFTSCETQFLMCMPLWFYHRAN